MKFLLPFFLCTLVALADFIPTEEINYAYFNIIKQAYNQNNPTQIYKLFSRESQNELSLDDFTKQIEQIKLRSGDILFWSCETEDQKNPKFIVGFDKQLTTGVLTWSYINDKFAIFSLNDIVPSLLKFMKERQSSVAFSAIADDKQIIDFSGDRKQGTMSVFKITIAMEYSRQVSWGIISQNDWVFLSEVNKYFIKSLDTSHQTFIDEWTKAGKILQDQIRLKEIAIGMILFSSNACTEYLQTLLTMEKIEELVHNNSLDQTQTYYLSSFLLSYLNFDNLPREQYLDQIRSYTPEIILEKSNKIHDILASGSEEAQKLLDDGKQLLDGTVLGIQTKLFPQASTNSYTKLLSQLNNEKIYYDSNFYDIFYPLIGVAYANNTAYKNIYEHIGQKGGSSAYSDDLSCFLNNALFSNLKKPQPYKRISFALFMQNLFFQDYESIIYSFSYTQNLMSINGLYLNEFVSRLQKNETIVNEDNLEFSSEK